MCKQSPHFALRVGRQFPTQKLPTLRLPPRIWRKEHCASIPEGPSGPWNCHLGLTFPKALMDDPGIHWSGFNEGIKKQRFPNWARQFGNPSIWRGFHFLKKVGCGY
jgi:hypothetical protein